tara:strand:- start:1379 stop:1825 length:447 start_codon:yes stop_codon:yes gene_type:complete
MQELSIFFVAASPVVELRGAIPLALLVYELPLWQAFFLSVAGNMVPVLLLPFLGGVSNVLSKRFSLFERYFTWLFSKTSKNKKRMFEIFRDFALVVFVAIPLPFTGAWTAMVAAFVFQIPFRRAFPLIFLGVIIAGGIVSFITLGLVP